MKSSSFIIIFLSSSFINLFSLGHITTSQKKDIGMQIWQNEAGKKSDLLVFWNPNEPFPSLGIGHFIWYPADRPDLHTQMFPDLLEYLKKRGKKLPLWLENALHKGAPWATKKDFDEHKNDWRMKELKKILVDTIDIQVDFFIERLKKSLPSILEATSKRNQAIITHHFQHLCSTPQGTYALIDYLNFKGDGTNIRESYNRIGWGLLQVLESMPRVIPQGKEVEEFVNAAKFVLERRIINAPADKSHEKNWLPGWKKRIDTYLTFNYTQPKN
jgi:hypothetical protein